MKVEIRLESPKKSDAPPSYELARRMPSPTPRRKRSSVTRVENVESSAGSDEDCEELDDEKDNKAEVPDSKLELTRSEAGDSEVSTADSNELGEEDRCDDVGLKKLKDQSKKMKRERERQTLNYYDQHTHTVITRLRAVNKRLQHQLEQQNKLIATMTDEKKQRLLQIESLRAEVQMHKQTLRALHVHRTHKTHEVSLPAVPKPPQQENSREEKADNSRAKVPHSTISPRRRPPSSSPRVQTTADYQGRPCSGRQSYDTNLQIYMTKLEKFDEERKEVQQRHAHQLANYSHELSRLERLLEKAHTAIQEKENELRLHRTRQLYCHTPTRPRTTSTLARRRKSNPGNTFTPNGDTFQMQNIFSDDIWKELLPLPPSDKPVETISASSSSLTSMSFTTHVGQAFEQLLRHQLVALHDSTLDRSTRDWLQEVKLCGSQMVSVHQSFQVMARSLQRVAECTHMYQLAETLTEECRELMHAEQVLVLVVDKSEHEFWCRLSRTENNTEKMATVRSALPPLSNSSSAKSNISASVPCGLAAFVYHTRRAILLPAGHMTKHQSYSTAPDNADRLVTHPHASTLLVPIEHDNNVVAVVQVSGKLTEVQALGLSIALEKCDAFTPQDQALLTLLCHFSSGLFPKVAYFTDVESNKVNEETFIRLAPQIFTCLHFDQLGKVVIENAKNILDADRCSLFVADTATRTLHNWHSDISGAGVKVYQRSAQKVNAGMTIHFGQGIVGLVAETQESINIPDAYEDPRFNSAWDQKTHYRTKSMLTVPIISNTLDKPRPDKTEDSSEDSARDQTLLGVVQVINKSGGAPFRSKDEFLLQTISKLIALAIENSQLFQRNQELCWNVGKLIGDGDIVEAIVSLGMAAEQIIGVQGAAVYVVDPDTNELVTFHHKRRHRIAVSEASYAGSLMEEAVRLQQLTIVNDTTKTGSFNAFVDSLNGISARNVLFAPLLVEEAEGIIPGMNRLVENADTGASFSVDSGQRMVGLLQLVNTTRRKTHFDEHDLFLSIVQSQSCSVLAAILEKQRMLRQKEQIALLLDASMSFFKEMSVVGVINAVYNACVSIFDASTTAHLFVYDEGVTPLDKMHERHMWSSKISPQAAAALAPHNSSTTALYQGTSMSFYPVARSTVTETVGGDRSDTACTDK